MASWRLVSAWSVLSWAFALFEVGQLGLQLRPLGGRLDPQLLGRGGRVHHRLMDRGQGHLVGRDLDGELPVAIAEGELVAHVTESGREQIGRQDHLEERRLTGLVGRLEPFAQGRLAFRELGRLGLLGEGDRRELRVQVGELDDEVGVGGLHDLDVGVELGDPALDRGEVGIDTGEGRLRVADVRRRPTCNA